MTLGIYNRKESYFAYDEKSSGGCNGITEVEKATLLVEDGIRKFLSFHAGIAVQPSKVLSLMKAHLKGEDVATELYDYREAMFQFVGDNAEIFVYDFTERKGYVLNDKSVQLVIKDTVCIGSGSYYAEGALLFNPYTNLGTLFGTIAKYDVYTGEDYKLIKL